MGGLPREGRPRKGKGVGGSISFQESPSLAETVHPTAELGARGPHTPPAALPEGGGLDTRAPPLPSSAPAPQA